MVALPDEQIFESLKVLVGELLEVRGVDLCHVVKKSIPDENIEGSRRRDTFWRKQNALVR